MRSRDVLSANLMALMEATRALDTQQKVADAAGVGQTTISRMSRGDGSTRIASIEAVASAFGLESWQLLVPGLDPKNQPVLTYETNTFVQRLSCALDETKITASALAEAIGISRSAVSQLLSGKSKSMTPANLFAVADHLGYSARWLATGAGPKRLLDRASSLMTDRHLGQDREVP